MGLAATSIAILASDVDKPSATRNGYRVGTILSLEFREDALDTCFYGLLRNMQSLADAPVLMTTRNEAQDAQLPSAQILRRRKFRQRATHG